MRFLPLAAFVAALGFAGFLWPASADAYLRHPLIVAATGGACSFDNDRGLRDEATVGARSGVGMGDFVTLWTDLSYSNPLQKANATAAADVYSLRMLVQIDALRTRVAPYAVVGAGGVLYSFDNAAGTAAGVLVLGGGVRCRMGRTVLFVEGKGEMSRIRSIETSDFGEPTLSADRTTTWNESLVGGFGVEF
ncbi:MAG TPA: hypothetical protein VE326_14800 [Candidatus Binatia bacterium]|nr:hypothetical protein [Candidatus Binatia bacterium]